MYLAASTNVSYLADEPVRISTRWTRTEEESPPLLHVHIGRGSSLALDRAGAEHLISELTLALMAPEGAS